jgi:type I restriction enzyme S subunit
VSEDVRKKIQLGQLGEITAGPSGSLLDNLHDGPDGVPVISPSDLAERNAIDGRHVRRVPWERAGKLARFALQEGDLLVVRQGSLGRLGLVSEEQANWLYSSSFLRVRPRRNVVLPEYLVSYLSYAPVQRELLSRALPGTIPSLNSAMLNQLSIVVPPVERQRAVIEVLADVDSQIAIQRAIADRLDTLKSAIFAEMIEGAKNS